MIPARGESGSAVGRPRCGLSLSFTFKPPRRQIQSSSSWSRCCFVLSSSSSLVMDKHVHALFLGSWTFILLLTFFGCFVPSAMFHNIWFFTPRMIHLTILSVYNCVARVSLPAHGPCGCEPSHFSCKSKNETPHDTILHGFLDGCACIFELWFQAIHASIKFMNSRVLYHWSWTSFFHRSNNRIHEVVPVMPFAYISCTCCKHNANSSQSSPIQQCFHTNVVSSDIADVFVQTIPRRSTCARPSEEYAVTCTSNAPPPLGSTKVWHQVVVFSDGDYVHQLESVFAMDLCP